MHVEGAKTRPGGLVADFEGTRLWPQPCETLSGVPGFGEGDLGQ